MSAEPLPDGLATAEMAARIRDGYTIQHFQPQTFCHRIHRLLAAMEAGWLPLRLPAPRPREAGTGVAPRRRRGLGAVDARRQAMACLPLQGFELPSEPSPSLSEGDIGDSVLDVILEEGDVLYLPRGWVHQAVSTDGGFSTHLTVSAYQRHAWADYLGALLPKLLSRASDKERVLRSGLPRRFLEHAGSFALAQSVGLAGRRAGEAGVAEAGAVAQDGPGCFAVDGAQPAATMPLAPPWASRPRRIGGREVLLSRLTPRLIHEAADELGAFITKNRLPRRRRHRRARRRAGRPLQRPRSHAAARRLQWPRLYVW